MNLTGQPANVSADLTTWLVRMYDSSTDGNPRAVEAITIPPELYRLIRKIYFYAMACVIPFGLLCNSLAVAVFINTPALRRTVTGNYLVSLALADTLFLFGDFIRWLNPTTADLNFGVDFMHHVNVVCKVIHYMRYVGKFASAWLTVCITAQRFILVAMPLKASAFCTPSLVKKTIIINFCVAAILNLYPFWTIGTVYNQGRSLCGYLDEKVYGYWTTAISRCGSVMIPACAILILTTFIVVDLLKVGKARRMSLINGSQSAVNSSFAMELHLSVMLVVVAISFLVLRLPYSIVYYINAYKEEMWNPIDPWLSFRIYCVYKVTDVIATLNHVINFFLYCFCGSSFRRHLVNLMKCKKSKPGKQVIQRANVFGSRTSSKKTEAIIFRFNTLKSNFVNHHNNH